MGRIPNMSINEDAHNKLRILKVRIGKEIRDLAPELLERAIDEEYEKKNKEGGE